jgi:propane 2-monooxygenase small subunit
MSGAGEPAANLASPEADDAGELLLRACLLSCFEVSWLGLPASDASADLLLQQCIRSVGSDGLRHWAVPDSTRRDVLRGAGLEQARRAWLALAHRPGDDRQWVIDRYVGAGQPVLEEARDTGRLAAVQDVFRWLSVLDGPAPSEWEVRSRLELRRILEPLTELAGRHFVGRAEILATLADDLRDRPGVTVIHGFGGIGKSSLAARHLLAAAEDGVLVCYLTFDHLGLDPARPASIAAAVCRQLAVQLSEPSSARVARIGGAAQDSLRGGHRAAEVSSRAVQLDTTDVGSIVSDLAAELGGRPCLLVLDAVEEAQRRGAPAVRTLTRLASQFVAMLRHTQILLVGRAPLAGAADLGFGELHLHGLDRADAAFLLDRLLADLDPGRRRAVDPDAVIEQVGTSPLCVRLAAGVLAKAPGDEALRDLAVQRGALEGELYRRLLGHIADPQVRRLAHPGLTLRRVTPDLIEHVLAGPCRVRVPDDQTAWRLFEGLASEAMLVERTPGTDEVVHRGDVRAVMLPRLAHDEPGTVARIHRAAIRYYSRRPGLSDRTEELYHRLMLGQAAATLTGRWQDGVGDGLLPSLDELPPASKAYVAERLGNVDISDEDLALARLETRRKLVVRRVQNLVAAGDIAAAGAELTRYEEETRDDSPSVQAYWVEVLELLGDLSGALQRADEQRRRAGRTGAALDLFEFTLHAARLLERMHGEAQAARELDGALEQARQLPRTEPYLLMRLRLIVARLALARRQRNLPPGHDDPFKDLREEGFSLFEALAIRSIDRVPGLLRDLAAELGEQFPQILVAAFPAVGISANPDQINEAMTKWDRTASAESGTTAGVLADAAGAGDDLIGGIDWAGWADAGAPAEPAATDDEWPGDVPDITERGSAQPDRATHEAGPGGSGASQRVRLGEQLAELTQNFVDAIPYSARSEFARIYQRESDVASVLAEERSKPRIEFTNAEANAREFPDSTARRFSYFTPAARKQSHYEDVTVELQPDPRHYLSQGWLQGFADGRGGYPLDWTALKAWGSDRPVPARFPGSGGQGHGWPALGWHEFRDPNEEWELTVYRYNANVERQLNQNIDNARRSGGFASWDESWVRFVARHVGAWMHVGHGLGLHLFLNASRRAPTSMHNNAIAVNSMHRIRSAEGLALYNLTLTEEIDGFDGAAHLEAWNDDPAWQGVRETAELLTAVDDWCEAVFAANVVFEPLVGELFRSGLVQHAAPRNGDFVTPTILGAEAYDFAERDLRYTSAMFRLLIDDREFGRPNTAILQRWLSEWVPRAVSAARTLQPLWSLPGGSLPSFEGSLAAARARFSGIVTGLGLDEPEKLVR